MLIAILSLPRSGQVWLTRLLADAIGCPTFTWLPQDRGRDIALEGLDRRSPHRVTRAHGISHETWPPPDYLIHLIRDPRDVIVSTAHFRFPELAGEPERQWDVATETVCGAWNNYAREARECDRATYGCPATWLTYEQLRDAPVDLVSDTLEAFGLSIPLSQIAAAVERQDFARRKAQIAATVPAKNAQAEFVHRTDVRHIRKGLVGEWRTALPARCVRRVRETCDPDLMEYFGYA